MVAWRWLSGRPLAAAAALGASAAGLLTTLAVRPDRVKEGATACLLLAAATLLAADRWLFPRQSQPVEGATPADAFSPSDLVVVALVTVITAVPLLIAAGQSLWYDELWTVNFMMRGPLSALTTQAGYNNHLLNSFLGSILISARKLMEQGQPAPWSSYFALARVPALLFGLASPPLLFLAARRAAGRSAAALAGLLLALSPAALDLAAQSRGYSALICLTIANAAALSCAVASGSWGWWLAWLVTAVIGTAAHLYMLFPVTVSLILVVCLAIQAVRSRAPGKARALIGPAGACAVAWGLVSIALYLPTLHVIVEQLRAESGMRPMAHAHDLVAPLLQSWTGAMGSPLRWPAYALVAALVPAGVWRLWKRSRSLCAYVLLLLLLPPLIVEAAHPHFVYLRFFAFAMPAFYLLLGAGIDAARGGMPGTMPGRPQPAKEQSALDHPRGSGRGWMREGVLVGLATLAGLGLLVILAPGLEQVLRYPKQNYRAAAEAVRRAQARGQAVAAVGAGSEYLGSYGARPYVPRTVAALRSFVQTRGLALVVDTGLVLNPREPEAPTVAYTREHGTLVRRWPGRFAGWPARWLDGDSDFSMYMLNRKGFTFP